MLIEDLFAEIKQPFIEVQTITEQLYNKILENRCLFLENNHRKQFYELIGTCSVLSITHEYFENVFNKYQNEINNNYKNLMETEI